MAKLIQPIISMPEAVDPTKVIRLVEHCFQLDGTKVIINKISQAEDDRFRAAHPHNTFFSLQAHALRLEALAMKGKPFIHLEPDSIPLRPGWVKKLSEEYSRLKKPYLLSSDSHPPSDLVGGIGIYGPDTAWMIPDSYRRASWDLWMINHLRPLVAFTPLIQHKYGIYDGNGVHKVDDIRFPRDAKLLREDAWIFHRDPNQTLIKLPESEKPRKASRGDAPRFLHSGCIGDLIAALPTIRQLGGGHVVMTQKGNPRILRGPRYEFLREFVSRQPYIESITWEEEAENIDYDFTDFRSIYRPTDCLADLQAKFIGITQLDKSPWLSCDQVSNYSRGKVVIARSSRYHNPHFPWDELVEKYRDRLVFVGLAEEHAAFCNVAKRDIQWIGISNMADLAALIAGADLFIGNQSSPFWVAAGLGVDVIQETNLANPDSIIIRDNIQYVQTKWVDYEFFKKEIAA